MEVKNIFMTKGYDISDSQRVPVIMNSLEHVLPCNHIKHYVITMNALKTQNYDHGEYFIK